MTKIDDQTIAYWLQRAEHENLEFKEAKNNFDFAKLVQYMVAFANEGGGTLIFGVTDKIPRVVVGTEAFTNLNELKKKLHDELRLHIEVTEHSYQSRRLLIFVAPARPRGGAINYRGAYWMRVGESLMPMTDDRLKAIHAELDVGRPTDSDADEIMLEAGTRVARLRRDLNLPAGKMVEMLGLTSEKLLLAMESGSAEISIGKLKRLCNVSGMSLDWLKYGLGAPYPSSTLDTYRNEEVDRLCALKAEQCFAVLDDERLLLTIMAKEGQWKWSTWHLSASLDFWNWMGDQHYIPEILDMLKRINTAQHPHGRVVTRALYSELVSGNAHPGEWLKKAGPGKEWFDDMFDVAHAYSKPDWYGPWFAKLQESVFTYLRR